jgi:hypothetical protein
MLFADMCRIAAKAATERTLPRLTVGQAVAVGTAAAAERAKLGRLASSFYLVVGGGDRSLQDCMDYLLAVLHGLGEKGFKVVVDHRFVMVGANRLARIVLKVEA